MEKFCLHQNKGKLQLEKNNQKLNCDNKLGRYFGYKFWQKDHYLNLKAYYSMTVPFYSSFTPYIAVRYCPKMVKQKTWLDIVVRVKRIGNNTVNLIGLMKYPNQTLVLVKRNNFKKLETRRDRQYMILIKSKQHLRDQYEMMIKITTKWQRINAVTKPVLNLTWRATVQFSNIVSFKCLSLPGEIKSLTVSSLSSGNKHFNVYWIHNNFFDLKTQPTKCSKDIIFQTDYTYCLIYKTVSQQNKNIAQQYTFFWNIYRSFELDTNSGKDIKGKESAKILKSWNKASDFCKMIGGNLPLIRTRNELLEIISIFKLSKDMPPVEAIFIGLTRNVTMKVKWTYIPTLS